MVSFHWFIILNLLLDFCLQIVRFFLPIVFLILILFLSLVRMTREDRGEQSIERKELKMNMIGIRKALHLILVVKKCM